MAGRRLLLFVFLLVLIGAIAGTIAPQRRDQAARQTLPTAPLPPSPSADVVQASLPGKRDVRARVGDVVELDVRQDVRDVVQVVALGVAEPVEPGLAAQLVFDADRPGRFAVTLRDARQRIGTVDVRAAG